MILLNDSNGILTYNLHDYCSCCQWDVPRDRLGNTHRQTFRGS